MRRRRWLASVAGIGVGCAARGSAKRLDGDRALTFDGLQGYADIQKWRPLEFLMFLRDHPELAEVRVQRESRWVKDDEVDALVEKLESRQPCPCVSWFFSSFYFVDEPKQRSFIGREALFMLQGYRHGAYPPGDHSATFVHNFEKTAEGFLEWLRVRREQ